MVSKGLSLIKYCCNDVMTCCEHSFPVTWEYGDDSGLNAQGVKVMGKWIVAGKCVSICASCENFVLCPFVSILQTTEDKPMQVYTDSTRVYMILLYKCTHH